MRLAVRSSVNAARSASGRASGVSLSSKSSGSFWYKLAQSQKMATSGKYLEKCCLSESRFEYICRSSTEAICASCLPCGSG